MKRGVKKNRCEIISPIYKDIINHKNNGKLTHNGVRIGGSLQLNLNTNLIEKYG